MSGLEARKALTAVQIVVLLVLAYAMVNIVNDARQPEGEGVITVTDTTGAVHTFDAPPERIVVSNTFGATAMKMLDADMSSVVGISGDFSDETLWPELVDLPWVQFSAHSEIDYEALLDVRPDVYVVFATNGMVDTAAIRDRLAPLGIDVVAFDFYKYDALREEFNQLALMLDKMDAYEDLMEEFDAIEDVMATALADLDEAGRPAVVMEHHASLTRDPVVLTGSSQWDDIIRIAGGQNVFSDLPGHTTHVDMEAILNENPDVMMFDGITFELGYDLNDPKNGCTEHFNLIQSRPGFDAMQAVENDHLLIFSGAFAGPMMVHGLPFIAEQFHPERFEEGAGEALLDGFYTDHFSVDRTGTFLCTMTGE
ncbi:MAG TPA: ABC transporter substrate-binding protein [Candidatus Poseidoniaceae archaeon]|nr:MAG TPA: ABC transporter substrate-binding protein [Candidatus Poseidoniales archaeon]HIH53234.1 ABC transporter substrate-binding protein [Candidatus Poseidoniaceae archaeon]|tara:strand:+ start:4 stop:1107 length:1104 start_codon:yes stop_codon:yes gene_type:complete